MFLKNVLFVMANQEPETGFEPVPPAISAQRTSQLSYEALTDRTSHF